MVRIYWAKMVKKLFFEQVIGFFTKVPVIEEAPGGVDVIVNFIRVNCQDFFLSEMTKLISTWKQCKNFDFNLNQSSKHDLK